MVKNNKKGDIKKTLEILHFCFCSLPCFYSLLFLSTKYAIANLFLCGALPHDPASWGPPPGPQTLEGVSGMGFMKPVTKKPSFVLLKQTLVVVHTLPKPPYPQPFPVLPLVLALLSVSPPLPYPYSLLHRLLCFRSISCSWLLSFIYTI